jgi:hypothetical protein
MCVCENWCIITVGILVTSIFLIIGMYIIMCALEGIKDGYRVKYDPPGEKNSKIKNNELYRY